ncbi:MAG: ABC transporter permease, partial [Planctomycetaceae bacterium]
QTMEIALPHQIIQMIPYLLTIVILAGGVVKSRPPAALGNHYRSGGGT